MCNAYGIIIFKKLLLTLKTVNAIDLGFKFNIIIFVYKPINVHIPRHCKTHQDSVIHHTISWVINNYLIIQFIQSESQ